MLSRKIDQYIKEHYSSHNSALLLTGARQTGKTYAIRKFAKDAGLNLIEINFYQDSSASKIFSGARDAKDVLLRLSAYAVNPLIPGKTLIFFDEIQKCQEVVTWIKFLVDEGSFKYALSGSLLGLELNNIRSVPVGYLAVKEVFPLDLEEFFLAIGVSTEVMEAVNAAWKEDRSVDSVVHESLIKLVNLYLIVGGMPAAVQVYIDTNDLKEVKSKQTEIVDLYKWDISQYDPDKKLYTNEIFDLIPSELNARNKRFILKNLNEHARFSKYDKGFLWLKDAGVALPTYNVEEPVPPLKLNEQRNLVKLFQNDVGLLSSQYEQGLAFRILSGEITVNYGSVYENLVAQELSAHGYNLYFFNSKKLGEIDFLIESWNGIVPVEVKSGKDYERHNALSNILKVDNYDISEAIVLCNDNLRISGNVKYLPIYMLMYIKKREDMSAHIFPPDLSGLK